MSLLTFDTHAFINNLVAAGMPEKQAEALSENIRKVQETNLEELATKGDLQRLEDRIDKRFAEVMGEQKLMKWMLGFLSAGVVSVLFLLFKIILMLPR